MNVLSILLSFLMLVFVNPGSLDVQENCWEAGQYHFVINQIDSSEAPDSVHVYFENGLEGDAMSITKEQNVTHYRLLYGGQAIANASAMLPEGWTGQFNLSCEIATGIELVDFKVASSDDGIGYVVVFTLAGLIILGVAISVWRS